MSGDIILHTPAFEALHAFDAENNVEPTRAVAQRIAAKYSADINHPIVDDIQSALEDAYNLGERRGPYVARAFCKSDAGSSA